ncbi:MAG: hypothetical protein ACO3CD_04375 [Candidatus Nanopelagicaceae bacterium]
MQVDFTDSSAIRSILVEGNAVSIIFTSGDTVYNFNTNQPEVIESFLQNPEGSVGKTYREWVANGIITIADQPEPVTV